MIPGLMAVIFADKISTLRFLGRSNTKVSAEFVDDG